MRTWMDSLSGNDHCESNASICLSIAYFCEVSKISPDWPYQYLCVAYQPYHRVTHSDLTQFLDTHARELFVIVSQV